MSEPTYLTTDEIASRLRYARATVVGWINDGILTPSGRIYLRALKVGGEWRIEPKDLAKFIADQNPELHRQLAEEQEEGRRQAEAEARELDRRLEGRGPRKRKEK